LVDPNGKFKPLQSILRFLRERLVLHFGRDPGSLRPFGLRLFDSCVGKNRRTTTRPGFAVTGTTPRRKSC
jgi:hypothetical protein